MGGPLITLTSTSQYSVIVCFWSDTIIHEIVTKFVLLSSINRNRSYPVWRRYRPRPCAEVLEGHRQSTGPSDRRANNCLPKNGFGKEYFRQGSQKAIGSSFCTTKCGPTLILNLTIFSKGQGQKLLYSPMTITGKRKTSDCPNRPTDWKVFVFYPGETKRRCVSCIYCLSRASPSWSSRQCVLSQKLWSLRSRSSQNSHQTRIHWHHQLSWSRSNSEARRLLRK